MAQDVTDWEVIEGHEALDPAWSDAPEDNKAQLHVVPRNDLYPHVLSFSRCWCHPTVDEDAPNVVVHSSADGREDYETGKRRLN